MLGLTETECSCSPKEHSKALFTSKGAARWLEKGRDTGLVPSSPRGGHGWVPLQRAQPR